MKFGPINAQWFIAGSIAGLSLAQPPVPDCRTLFGVARGTGEVTVSPGRGCRLSSRTPADVAFAQTSGPLPMCYRITLAIDKVDVYHAGCRFGVFDGAVCFGGDNEAINSLTRYAVVFHEWKKVRRLYLWYFDGTGSYHCWDGDEWRRGSWRPTGSQWSPSRSYTLTIAKGPADFRCSVAEDGTTLVEPAPVPVTAVRGAGQPDYLAFGDLATDYGRGDVTVTSLQIREETVSSYLETDMEHVVIRQAPQGRYAMYGGLTKLPDGELFCLYKVGSIDKDTGSPWTVRDETIVWTRSNDRGRRWPEAENVIYADGTTRQENCCSKGHLTRDGTIVHPFYILNPDYEERAKEENWSRLHLAVGRGTGAEWQVRPVETPFACAASFGGIVRLRDGRLLLNVYGAVEPGTFRHQAGILHSTDDGRTWGDYTPIGSAADPDGGAAKLNETDIAELPDGRLLSMSRTQYHGFPLYRGISNDGGRAWSVGPSGLTGLCPCLWYSTTGPPAGTVALVYHDRWGKHAAKGGVYVVFSTDGGETWGEPLWISGGAYPCMLEIEPGILFVSYYQSNSLLRGTIFPVPFPTGLRARTGAAATDRAGVRLEWDPYTGAQAGRYSYRVYRSTDPDVPTTDDNVVVTCGRVSTWDDHPPEPGTVYSYRVVALDGDTQVGRSWTAAARAGRTATQ